MNLILCVVSFSISSPVYQAVCVDPVQNVFVVAVAFVMTLGGDPWWNSVRDGQLDDDKRNHVDEGCIKPGGQWDTDEPT